MLIWNDSFPLAHPLSSDIEYGDAGIIHPLTNGGSFTIRVEDVLTKRGSSLE